MLNSVISITTDKAIVVLDGRMNLHEKLRFDNHHKDFIYSSTLFGPNILFTGDGSGMLLVHDLEEGNEKLCYGMGANQGAVRFIIPKERERKLVAGGDDGNIIEYSY